MTQEVLFSLDDLLASPTNSTFLSAVDDKRHSINGASYIPIKLDLGLQHHVASMRDEVGLAESLREKGQSKNSLYDRSSSFSARIMGIGSTILSPLIPPSPTLSYTSSVYTDYNTDDSSSDEGKPSTTFKSRDTPLHKPRDTSVSDNAPDNLSHPKEPFPAKILKGSFKAWGHGNRLDKALPILPRKEPVSPPTFLPSSSSLYSPTYSPSNADRSMPKSISGRLCCICEEPMEFLINNEKPVILQCSHVCHYMCLLQLVDINRYDCDSPERNISNGIFSECPNCCRNLNPVDEKIAKLLISEAMLEYHQQQRNMSLKILKKSGAVAVFPPTGYTDGHRVSRHATDSVTAAPQTPKSKTTGYYRQQIPGSDKSDGSVSTLYSTPTKQDSHTKAHSPMPYSPMGSPVSSNSHLSPSPSFKYKTSCLTNEQLAALPLSQRRIHRSNSSQNGNHLALTDQRHYYNEHM